MRKDKFIVFDKISNEEERIKNLILNILLDEIKLKTFNVKIKNGNVKIWIYHNINYDILKNYENQYKKELDKIEKKIKN